MDGQYTPGSGPDPSFEPEIVAVGAVTRDLSDADPRGWRLGGGVAYGALTAARLGLRTAAVIGVDELAAGAEELALLRDAGVALRLVRLARGPVFRNEESSEGRRQVSEGPSDPVPIAHLPRAWTRAPGWLLAPVAAELPDDWARVPDEAAFVAVAWQGLLRELTPGEPVHHLSPSSGPLLSRADLVGVGADDLEPHVTIDALAACVRRGATLVLTQGARGGLVAEWPDHMRRWPALAPDRVVDPVGAGDVFLAAMAAARIQPRLVGGRIGQGYDLLLAAAAASLVLEADGLLGVADRTAVARRMSEAAARRHA
jgi:sugar/nucleoside kinase (ribokinase family)